MAAVITGKIYGRRPSSKLRERETPDFFCSRSSRPTLQSPKNCHKLTILRLSEVPSAGPVLSFPLCIHDMTQQLRYLIGEHCPGGGGCVHAVDEPCMARGRKGTIQSTKGERDRQRRRHKRRKESTCSCSMHQIQVTSPSLHLRPIPAIHVYLGFFVPVTLGPPNLI